MLIKKFLFAAVIMFFSISAIADVNINISHATLIGETKVSISEGRANVNPFNRTFSPNTKYVIEWSRVPYDAAYVTVVTVGGEASAVLEDIESRAVAQGYRVLLGCPEAGRYRKSPITKAVLRKYNDNKTAQTHQSTKGEGSACHVWVRAYKI